MRDNTKRPELPVRATGAHTPEEHAEMFAVRAHQLREQEAEQRARASLPPALAGRVYEDLPPGLQRRYDATLAATREELGL